MAALILEDQQMTILAGGRAGQTFSVDRWLLSGQIAAGANGMGLTTPEAFEEVITFSNGDVQHNTILPSSNTGSRRTPKYRIARIVRAPRDGRL